MTECSNIRDTRNYSAMNNQGVKNLQNTRTKEYNIYIYTVVPTTL